MKASSRRPEAPQDHRITVLDGQEVNQRQQSTQYQ